MATDSGEEAEVEVGAHRAVVRQLLVDRLQVNLVADERRGQGRTHEDEVLAPGHVTLAERRRRGHILFEGMTRVLEPGAGEEFGRVPIGDFAFAGRTEMPVVGVRR